MDYSRTTKPAFNEHSTGKEERVLNSKEEGDKEAGYYAPKLTHEMKNDPGADQVRRRIAAEKEYQKWLKYRTEPPQKVEKPLPQDFNDSVANDSKDYTLFDKLYAQKQAREHKNTNTAKLKL